jgi:ABC-type Zn2+ transport system substrate-binding protein/surface adhesin
VVTLAACGESTTPQAAEDTAPATAEPTADDAAMTDEDHDHAEDEDYDHDHEHSGADPHVWMSPTNVMVWTDNIAATLATLDPANADTYATNAASYTADLEELDAWIEEQIAQILEENRELVTDHTAFGYYVHEYELEQVGAVVPAYSTLAEPLVTVSLAYHLGIGAAHLCVFMLPGQFALNFAAPQAAECLGKLTISEQPLQRPSQSRHIAKGH